MPARSAAADGRRGRRGRAPELEARALRARVPRITMRGAQIGRVRVFVDGRLVRRFAAGRCSAG